MGTAVPKLTPPVAASLADDADDPGEASFGAVAAAEELGGVGLGPPRLFDSQGVGWGLAAIDMGRVWSVLWRCIMLLLPL